MYAFYLTVSSILWDTCQKDSSVLQHLAHTRNAGVFDCFFGDCLILSIMSNGRGHCGSPEMQGSQPNPQRNRKLEKYDIKQIDPKLYITSPLFGEAIRQATVSNNRQHCEAIWTIVLNGRAYGLMAVNGTITLVSLVSCH